HISYCSVNGWSLSALGLRKRRKFIHQLLMFASCLPNRVNLCDDPTINRNIKYCLEYRTRDRQLIRAFRNCAEEYKYDKLQEKMANNIDLIIKNSSGPMYSGGRSLYNFITTRKGEGKSKEKSTEKSTQKSDEEKNGSELRVQYLTDKEIAANFEDCFKAFEEKNMKDLRAACQLLGKRRNIKNKAVRASKKAPDNQALKEKADVATAEYDTQLGIVTEMLKKIPEYDKIHQDIFEQALRYFATAF
ncbi:hypothetical protein V3C99_006053, partial [Haemonchus contortus]